MHININKIIAVMILLVFLFYPQYHVLPIPLYNKDLPDRTGFKTGPLIMHAAYKQKVEYDDNIYLDENDTKSDTIIIMNPSIGLELPIDDHSISLDYDAGIYMFSDYQKEDHVDHVVRGRIELNVGNYQLSFQDDYKNFAHRSGSENTGRIKQQNNYMRVGFRANFNQIDFDASYTFGVEDYLTNDALYQSMTYNDKDRVENVFGSQIKYRFRPRTAVIFESRLGFISYESNLSSDSYFSETFVGLDGELYRNLTAEIKGGARYQNYYESDLTSSNNFAGFVAKGYIKYEVTNDDWVRLDTERAVYESTYDNINYYETNFINLSYIHWFTNKVSLKFYGFYQLNLYPSRTLVDGVWAKRYDNFYAGGLIFRYDVREWLSIQMKYKYLQRESRFSDFDYSDNVLSVEATVGF